MQITYFVQALFVAVALAAPAPQGDDLPSGIFPSGVWPTGTGGIPAPTGTGVPFPTGTGGGGHHHHTRTRTHGSKPTDDN
ncbi:hypothetical protein V494_00045 [Pseudogymnoascus sp. VKM F-4513 (FW-928)]|nr:hypothetical protein V494_00045 [Pseudogymnoascus sp. VKM F-4513 (FW-928)]